MRSARGKRYLEPASARARAAAWRWSASALASLVVLVACDGGAPSDRDVAAAGARGNSAAGARAATPAGSGASPAQATRLDALSSEGMPSGFTLALKPR